MLRAGRTFPVLLTALVSIAPEARAWDASRSRSATSRATRPEAPAPARAAHPKKTDAPQPKAPDVAKTPAKEALTKPASPKPAAPHASAAKAPVKESAPRPPLKAEVPKEPAAGTPKEAARPQGKPAAVAKEPPAVSATTKHDTTKKASRPTKPEPPPVPSYFRMAKPPPPGASWAPYYRAPWKRGYVTLFGHGKKWSGYLIGSKGEVPPASRASLSSMLASWRTGKEALIDERLVAMIALASDEFGGRAIRIVSGYREMSYAPDSKHKVGQALDFSIPGVPNEALRDYLRTLSDVGIGFYPNSTHVHLDVREKTTYWVDYSFPGERPHYAYEPSVRGWGPRERAIADALDRLPSSLVAQESATPLVAGKPALPLLSRTAPNRATFAPVAAEVKSSTARTASPDAGRGVTLSAPAADGGVPQRGAADSGVGFWSRAASTAPTGASSPDGGVSGLFR
jgi:Bacterial protein of unknown function (DUF882)